MEKMETKENITEEKNKEKHVSADTCTRWGIYEVVLDGQRRAIHLPSSM